MQIFRLLPIDLHSANWRPSSHRGVVLVRAHGEEIAREVACMAFSQGVDVSLHANTLMCPWRSERLVSCEVEDDTNWDVDGPVEILEPPHHNEVVSSFDWESYIVRLARMAEERRARNGERWAK